jgi:hypothetical protein
MHLLCTPHSFEPVGALSARIPTVNTFTSPIYGRKVGRVASAERAGRIGERGRLGQGFASALAVGLLWVPRAESVHVGGLFQSFWKGVHYVVR